jgi:hypothetical protein
MIYTISNIRVKFNAIVVQLWWFGDSQNGEGKKKKGFVQQSIGLIT